MRRLDAFGGTHQGRVRPINEDRFLCDPGRGVLLVADGMGGHSHGDIASSAIVSHVAEAVGPRSGATPGATLGAMPGMKAVTQGVRAANDAIVTISQENDDLVIGSTVAALVLGEDRYEVAWTGDSRVYRLRGGEILCLTDDHTEPNMLRREGRITREEAERWPRSHVIVHAVGVGPHPYIEMVEGDAHEGDVFVVCSDGLTTHVEDHEIAELAGGGSAERICKDLVLRALERGGTDNVTVVVARLEGGGSRLEGGN